MYKRLQIIITFLSFVEICESSSYVKIDTSTCLTNAFPKDRSASNVRPLNALKFEMMTNVMHYVRYCVNLRAKYVYQNQIQQLRTEIPINILDRPGWSCSLKKLKIVYGFAFVLCNRLDLEQQQCFCKIIWWLIWFQPSKPWRNSDALYLMKYDRPFALWCIFIKRMKNIKKINLAILAFNHSVHFQNQVTLQLHTLCLHMALPFSWFLSYGKILWFCNVFVCSRYWCLQRVHIPLSIQSVYLWTQTKRPQGKAMMRT